MSDNNYDVIISGCGPSGSLLGYLLAKDSIKTLIIDKEHFPRYKNCAGGIQHRALKILPYDVCPVIEKSITGIYFSFQNRRIVLKKYDSPILYTVKRTDFDNFLALKAKDSNCDIRFGERVLEFNSAGDYITVQTSLNKYRSKILVGADGIRGAVHRQTVKNNEIRKILGYEVEISLNRPPDILPADLKKETSRDAVLAKNKLQVGKTPVISGPEDEKFLSSNVFKDSSGNLFDFKDNLRLDFGGIKKGYCWVFPKKDVLSCGIGGPFKDAKQIKNYFKIFLDKFSNQGCGDSGPSKISAQGIPVMGNNTPFCSDRLLNIGDAACLADGFTGEGIYNCFRSSIIAHDCIKKALASSIFSFQDYFEKINNEIYREIKASLMFTKIFYGSVNIFYKLITENSNIFSSCCRILRGERSYNDALKKLKLFKL